MKNTHRLLVLLVLWLTVGGCGSAAFRDKQDWSSVSDSRLYRACHVTNWGSGVWIAHADGVSYILTCAHVLEGATSAKVHLFNPAAKRYETFAADVLHAGHPHKEDLAVLRLRTAPAFAEPFKTRLAPSAKEGQTQRAAVMNISFGAEDKPLAMEFPVVPVTQQVSSYIPDTDGKTQWVLTKGLVHGGISQANSGSPVFVGTSLYGLVESAPMLGAIETRSSASTRPQTTLVSGACTSTPDDVEAFLRRLDLAQKCLVSGQ